MANKVVNAGEWVQPKRKYYFMECCDCGLVHKMEIVLKKHGIGHKIFWRAWRDEKATKKARRGRRVVE